MNSNHTIILFEFCTLFSKEILFVFVLLGWCTRSRSCRKCLNWPKLVLKLFEIFEMLLVTTRSPRKKKKKKKKNMMWFLNFNHSTTSQQAWPFGFVLFTVTVQHVLFTSLSKHSIYARGERSRNKRAVSFL